MRAVTPTHQALRAGLYRSGTTYMFRPVIDGRRTWKRLASLTETEARAEIATLLADHARSRLGLCRSPWEPRNDQTFGSAYAATGRPDHALLKWWGNLRLCDITRETAEAYAATRAHVPRACDIELATVSAVIRETLGESPLRGRRRVQDRSTVRHARECMPRDGDELHALARSLMASPRSEALGWQLLIQAMTGLRTQEVLALRTDSGPKGPGWIEGRYLYVRRAKAGSFPWVEIHPALAEALRAHGVWLHAFPHSPYWFPGLDGVRALNRVALTHALDRMDGPKRTPHGLRSYYVTVYRSLGESDAQVAARIGDTTVALISQVYGNLPEVWSGGEPLSWLPRSAEPAWAPWREAENVLEFRTA